MTSLYPNRLEGLEPDNLLAFLALLGLLRSLEAAEQEQPLSAKLSPKLSWDTNEPLRPRLHIAQQASQDEIAESAAKGLRILSRHYESNDLNREDLNIARAESRAMLATAAHSAKSRSQEYSDLLTSLMTDAAVKDGKDYDASPIDPTPFCLLFGQGHQHFLERFAGILREDSLPMRGERKTRQKLSLADCIEETLFKPWRREDPSTFAFRWDPEEDVRYALMAGDPTDPAYKGGTQHGANCLAVAGLAALTLVPETRAGRTRPAVIGGLYTSQGFSFAWPIWTTPLPLATIRSLLAHPGLRNPADLHYLGIEQVFVARRISVGKFMNFTRAQFLQA
jgi:hypothetical protein